MTKTIEQHFADWESDVFGFGYGSGEEHIIGALKTFMEAIPFDHLDKPYDYRILEQAVGPAACWLLINALCHADIIEYGTSPRHGWLDRPHGVALQNFIIAHSVDELVKMTDQPSDYAPCYPGHCNCDESACNNPFWMKWT